MSVTPPITCAQLAGEVIEASTTRFTAQCPSERLHLPPDFGAFVKILPAGVRPPLAPDALAGHPAPRELDPFADPVPVSAPVLDAATADSTLYALVYFALTGSIEPGRRAAAYGLEEDELHRQQPQIVALLATEFSALHVGYAQDGRIRSHLPPRPPRLHARVWECTPAEVCALTEDTDFLRPLLVPTGEVSPDELIAACLRSAYLYRDRDTAYLVRMGKQLAMLLREDPERLTALLRKLEP
jgi:hypothetical protein